MLLWAQWVGQTASRQGLRESLARDICPHIAVEDLQRASGKKSNNQ